MPFRAISIRNFPNGRRYFPGQTARSKERRKRVFHQIRLHHPIAYITYSTQTLPAVTKAAFSGADRSIKRTSEARLPPNQTPPSDSVYNITCWLGIGSMALMTDFRRRWWNGLQARWQYTVARNAQLSHYPVSLTVCPGNICNLRCALCPTG